MRYVYRVRVTPADVGSRVTLRARTGQDHPATTDTVGVLLAWRDDVLTVQRRDGSRVDVAAADLVAARVIPPRPERRRSQDR